MVPFYMTNVGFRAAPTLPWLSAFPELNVRTYVRVAERPGVYFFSLDAGRRLAVAAARATLNLPYYAAVMNVEHREAAVHYRSARRSRGLRSSTPSTNLQGALHGVAWARLSTFLTERYCLYHHDHRGRPYRLEIHHRPWSLQLARATITINTMAAASHLTINGSARALALRTASRRGRMGADASIRRPSTERTEGHRVTQLGDRRDVMFICSPRLFRHEIRRTPREDNLVCRRSTRRPRRW